jgi:hypothetical protein
MWRLPDSTPEDDLLDKPPILLLLLASALQTPITYSANSRPQLTNQDVATLVDLGFPKGLLSRAIAACDNEFDLCPDCLRDLKDAGATDQVIDAMLAANFEEACHGDRTPDECSVDAEDLAANLSERRIAEMATKSF